MMPDLPNVGLERDIEQFIVSLLCLGGKPCINVQLCFYLGIWFSCSSFPFLMKGIHLFELLLTHADFTLLLFVCLKIVSLLISLLYCIITQVKEWCSYCHDL